MVSCPSLSQPTSINQLHHRANDYPVLYRSTIYSGISDDGVTEIIQEQTRRTLYLGSSAKQSEMDMSQPEKLLLAYTQAMMAGLLFCPKPESVLLIGLGGGSLVRFLLHHFPDCQIYVVEFRADVVTLAYDYFSLPRESRLHITIGDGFEFLDTQSKAGGQYDLILVDAFDHNGTSDSIKSIAFFRACHESLRPKGVMAINLWNSPQDQYGETVGNIESAFDDHLLDMPVKDRGNVITFATDSRKGFPLFKVLKPVADMLEQRLDLPFGTYLRDLRRHNRWRALARLF